MTTLADFIRRRARAKAVREELDAARRVGLGYRNAARLRRVRQGRDSDQAWFWTPEWQAGERAADEDFAAGRAVQFSDVDDAVAWLAETPTARAAAGQDRGRVVTGAPVVPSHDDGRADSDLGRVRAAAPGELLRKRPARPDK